MYDTLTFGELVEWHAYFKIETEEHERHRLMAAAQSAALNDLSAMKSKR